MEKIYWDKIITTASHSHYCRFFGIWCLIIGILFFCGCGGGGGGGGGGTGNSSFSGELQNGDFEGSTGDGYPWMRYNGLRAVTVIDSPGHGGQKSGQLFLLGGDFSQEEKPVFRSASFNSEIRPDINSHLYPFTYEIPEFATGTKFEAGVWAKINYPLQNESRAFVRVSSYRDENGRLRELSSVENSIDLNSTDWEELKVEGDVATGTQFLWFSLIIEGDSSWSSGAVFFDDAYLTLSN